MTHSITCGHCQQPIYEGDLLTHNNAASLAIEVVPACSHSFHIQCVAQDLPGCLRVNEIFCTSCPPSLNSHPRERAITVYSPQRSFSRSLPVIATGSALGRLFIGTLIIQLAVSQRGERFITTVGTGAILAQYFETAQFIFRNIFTSPQERHHYHNRLHAARFLAYLITQAAIIVILANNEP